MDTMNKNKMLAHLRELESNNFTQVRKIRDEINNLYHQMHSLNLHAIDIQADISRLNESDSNEIPEGMDDRWFGY